MQSSSYPNACTSFYYHLIQFDFWSVTTLHTDCADADGADAERNWKKSSLSAEWNFFSLFNAKILVSKCRNM